MEDKAGIRHLLQLVLPHHGFDVLPASGGEEAVELYRQHHGEVDLALLDVQMPGLDGPDTLIAASRLSSTSRVRRL